MIFVITGSEAFQFDRLIETIDIMKKSNIIDSEIFIQLGSCNYIPAYCRWEKWLPFDQMIENIKKADVVISHAGAGTTLLCLEQKKTPILVTRRKKYGEHVDDHQVEFAEMMDRLGYASVAYDVSELNSVYQQMKSRVSRLNEKKPEKDRLIAELNNWFES